MKKIACLAVCTALLFTVCLQAAEISAKAEQRKIYSVGPGGGGALYNTKINPQDSNNIFIVCDMGSVFYTKDGKSFHNPKLNVCVSRPPQFFFNPHDKNVVYAASDNIVNVSHDKGETWNYFFPQPDDIAGVTNDGGWVRAIVKSGGVFAVSDVICVYVHPTEPDTVFVFARGGGYGAGFGSYVDFQNVPYRENPEIYVTRNGGKTWQVFNKTTIPGGRITSGDSGGFTRADGTQKINGDGGGALRFHQAEMIVFKNELHLLSAHGYFRFAEKTGELLGHNIYRNSAGQFVMSKDGKTLTAYQIITRDDVDDRYNNVAEHRKFPGYVSMGLASHTHLYPRHIFKTTDGGKTLTLVSGNFASDLVYTFHGLNKKMNNITVNNNELGYVNLKDISVSDDGTLCVLFSAIGRNSNEKNVSSGWYSSAAQTTDGGQTWKWIQDGNHRFVKSSVQFPAGIYHMHSDGFGHNQSGIGVSKSNPKHIIITGSYSANETRDGGLTWRDMSATQTVINEKYFFSTTGIEPAGQMTLAINPFNKQHHMAGWTDIGMWESFDGGKSWTRRNDVGGGNTSAIAFDPHNKNVVLAAFPNRQRDAMRGNSPTGYKSAACSCNWELPCEHDGRTGVIRHSINGGETWEDTASNIVVGIDGIIFHPAKKGVVFASTMGGGVYRSIDGGITWKPFNNGMSMQTRAFGGAQYRGIQIQRLILGKDKRTLLALLGGDASAATSITQVYSLDINGNATAWKEIERPNSETIGPIFDMDKTAKGILYAAPMSRSGARSASTGWHEFNGAKIRHVINGGAFISEDNGKSWRQIFDPRIDVKVLRADSRRENVIYLGGGQKMWVSYKGKDTTLADWKEIPGFYFANPDLIVEDTADSTRIYVTTWGGGTWCVQ